MNPQITVRDQVRCPGIPEQKILKTGCRRCGGQVCAMKGDVKKEHGKVEVVEKDWGEQSCRIEKGKL